MPYSFIPEYLVPYLPGSGRPWWMCVPKAPLTPCPVRPTGFVSLKDYDKDFKYPLASSRVAVKLVRKEECSVCWPNLVEPLQDCWSFTWPEGYGTTNDFRKEWFDYPDWFVMDDPVTIDFGPGYPTATYTTDPGSLWYGTNDDTISGPASGQGTLTQGSNSICLVWEIGKPGT